MCVLGYPAVVVGSGAFGESPPGRAGAGSPGAPRLVSPVAVALALAAALALADGVDDGGGAAGALG